MAAVRSNQHTSRLFRWAGQNANEFANNKLDILRDIDALPSALRALSSDDFVRHIVEFAFGTPTVKTPFIWDIVSDEIVNRDARSLGSDGIGRSLSALAKVNYVNNTSVIKSLRDKSLVVIENAALADYGVYLKAFTRLKFHPGDDFLDAVARPIMMGEKVGGDTQAICDVLYAFADFRPHDRDIFAQLASILTPSVKHFNSRDFSTVLSVYAKVKVKDNHLLSAVSKSLPSALQNFEPIELGSVCHGLALLGVRDATLTAQLSVHVQKCIHRMPAASLALVANAFDTFNRRKRDGIVDKSLFSCLAERASKVLHQFPHDPRELSTVLHCLVESNQANKNFSNMALRALLDRAESASRPQTLALVLRTLVKLKQLDGVDVVPCARAYCTRVVQLADRLTLIDVGEIGLAVSQLPVNDCKKNVTPVLIDALGIAANKSSSSTSCSSDRPFASTAPRSKDLAAGVLACAILASDPGTPSKVQKAACGNEAWDAIGHLCVKMVSCNMLSANETCTILKAFRMLAKDLQADVIVNVCKACLPSIAVAAERDKISLPDLAIAVHAIPSFEPLIISQNANQEEFMDAKRRLCSVAHHRMTEFSTRDAALVLSAVAGGSDDSIIDLLSRKDWQPTQLRLLGKGLLSAPYSEGKSRAFSEKVLAHLESYIGPLDKLRPMLVSQVALLNSGDKILEPVLAALPHAKCLAEMVKKHLASDNSTAKYHHELDLLCLTALADAGLRDRPLILVLIQRIAGSSLTADDCLRLLSALGHLSIAANQVQNLPLAQEGRSLTQTKWNKFVQLACLAAKTTDNIRYSFGLASLLSADAVPITDIAPISPLFLQARSLIGNGNTPMTLRQFVAITDHLSAHNQASQRQSKVSAAHAGVDLSFLDLRLESSPLLSQTEEYLQVLP